MIEPRLLVCNNYQLSEDDQRRDGRRVIELTSFGSDPNVYIQLEDVAKVFLRHLSPRLVDLIEIASYVYTADCATSRGEHWTEESSIEPWSRNFHFIIPVRDSKFWQQPKVIKELCRTLKYLSDDNYQFDFEEQGSDRPQQEYLAFSNDDDWPFYGVERVLMFSGGLDSLAGVVETASRGENLVLVSHRPVGTINKRQKQLFSQLRTYYPNSIIHIPVWINKVKRFGREHTQRSRSFLYSALGVVVAESVKASGVRFFENGIVSLNLPVADEVLRARASRTTHPLALDFLSRFYSLVVGKDFVIDNPFIFKTKSDVVSIISDNGAGELIPYTCSCAHSFHQSKTQWHCGTCSQCIDRRIAIVAANQSANDSIDDYKVDVFSGARKEGYERNMAVNFIRHGIELDQMSEEEMTRRFNLEFTRAVRPFKEKRETVQCFVDMHKRHGATVSRVLLQKLNDYLPQLLNGELDNTSMLRLAAGQEHMTSSWERFAGKIVELLTRGVPVACQSRQPENELRLQEICDGILKAYDNILAREFPFEQWSSSLTKPDWSSEKFHLWIELKYVRDKSNVRKITEDIAADITKYGDNNKRVLFVIYDPYHIITDENGFKDPIIMRPFMQVAFIR